LEIRPSPHFDERPEGERVSLLVIHNISLPPGEFGGPHIDELFMGRCTRARTPISPGWQACECLLTI
jgi:AmpD protein